MKLGVNYRHQVAQMKLDTYELKRTSALFWFTLVIPIGIIGVGINFILNPAGASAAYGVAINDPTSFPFMWIKGIRDIFSGLVILPFLLNGNRKVTAILFAISIFVPFCDGLVIIAHSGFAAAFDPLGNCALHDHRCRVPS